MKFPNCVNAHVGSDIMSDNPFLREDYKFGTESFLSMYLSQYQFVLGADLDYYAQGNELFNDENPCNIYFILRRPKVTIEPNSFYSKGKEAFFDFIIHDREKKGVLNIKIELNKANSKLNLVTEYPYNSFVIRDKEKTLLFARPSSLIDQVQVENNVSTEMLDYEILYIGQAYGKNGERTALDRLASHETVQKIYTHALTNNPESDIWIMLTSFSQLSVLFSGGSNETLQTVESKDRDSKITNNFFDNDGLLFSEKQKINFTEAALIKMFEPKYNKEFKNSFPNSKHSSYSECYSLDLRAITIELDTSDMLRNIYTEKTGRKTHHSKMYEFKNDQDRISLLGAFM